MLPHQMKYKHHKLLELILHLLPKSLTIGCLINLRHNKKHWK